MINHQLTLLEKVVGDADCLLQKSARIVTQVQNNPVDRLRVQLGEKGAQLVISLLVETRDLDVGNSRTEHEGLHGLRRDFRALELESQRLVVSGAVHRNADFRILGPL